ncbi:MAG: hypothetical protein IJC74_02355 [Clostridia bacterium]|nr:hypothetical protein [Clostridia bacterium]
MLTNKGVTVYHFTGHSGYLRYFYSDASVHSVFKNGSDLVKIRIPTTLFIPVCNGDYVFLGKSDAIVPEKEKCVRVTEFSDNRRGVNPHWRIVAG